MDKEQKLIERSKSNNIFQNQAIPFKFANNYQCWDAIYLPAYFCALDKDCIEPADDSVHLDNILHGNYFHWNKERLYKYNYPIFEVGRRTITQENLRENYLINLQLFFTSWLAQIRGPIPLVPIASLLFGGWLLLYFEKRPCISSNCASNTSSRLLRKMDK